MLSDRRYHEMCSISPIKLIILYMLLSGPHCKSKHSGGEGSDLTPPPLGGGSNSEPSGILTTLYSSRTIKLQELSPTGCCCSNGPCAMLVTGDRWRLVFGIYKPHSLRVFQLGPLWMSGCYPNKGSSGAAISWRPFSQRLDQIWNVFSPTAQATA